jgi:sporulation protein YlmC with PRC-barrel domain
MATNQFESSRIAGGTLNTGAHSQTGTSHAAAPVESKAISRDDTRDGFEQKSGEQVTAQDPENSRFVLAATTLTGDHVRNTAGEDLGRIEEVMLDIPTGRISYAVLSFGGFLGIGDKLFAVPWKALQIDTCEHEFILDIPRRALETAPGFDKNNWPDMADPEFSEPVHKFYNQRPYWEQDFTEAGDYTGDNNQHDRNIEEPVEGHLPPTKH